MGTRSRIGVMHGDKCKSVYCHWDGYLSGVGAVLLAHYDSSKANHLVAMGDMSSLRPLIEVPEGVIHNFDEPSEDVTVFYKRDRKESNVDFKVDNSFEEFLEQCDNCGAEYYYVMEDGEWFVGTVGGKFDSRLISLKQALAAETKNWETVTL